MIKLNQDALIVAVHLFVNIQKGEMRALRVKARKFVNI
jgi:hypothetical protein